MKDIKNFFESSKGTEYRVELLNCKDEEGLPISVSIVVDKENCKAFEDYLLQEQDNIFSHAGGGNVEF